MAFDLYKAWNLASNAMQQSKKVPAQTAQTPTNVQTFGGANNTASNIPQKGTPEWYAYELGRAQNAYREYGNNGRSDLQQNAHMYADQLRKQAQASGVDLSTYGKQNQYGTSFEDYYRQHADPLKPAGNYDPTKSGQVLYNSQPQQNNSDLLFQMFLDSLNGMQQTQQDQLEEFAKQQAQQQINTQKAQYQYLLDQSGTNLNTTLQRIKNSVADAKQAIEDESFQNWLAARQQMANRGLAGSDIASDQDTRLLLAKQKDLSGLFRDASTQAYEAQQLYNNMSNNINKQISNLNLDALTQQNLQQLVNSNTSSQNQKSELLLKALSEMMGYDYATVKDQMQYKTDQDKLNLEREKLRSDNWFNANGTWKDQADYQIKLSQLSLDQQKLVEQVKQWAQSNALEADRNAQGWSNLQEKTAYDSAMIGKFEAAANDAATKTTLSGLNNQLNSVTDQIKGYLNNGTTVPSSLTNAYNNIMNQVSRVLGTGGVDLSSVKDLPSTPDYLDRYRNYR